MTDIAQVVALSGAAATALGITVPGLISSLHALQQDDYSNRRFGRWLAETPVARLIHAPVALIYLVGAGLQLDLPLPLVAPTLASVAAIGATLLAPRPAPRKKPLVYTGRARRLLAVSAALTVALFVAGFVAVAALAGGLDSASGAATARAPGLAILLMAVVSIHAAPFVAMAANLVLVPVQASINRTYRLKARRKLARFKPMVVGITGSYGKTSTKYFAEALMESRFRVLKTRASFNTLLGVCRVVNEELGPEHEVLIVEMGAYRRGEIRDMARFVRPTIGVLTAIGPQHLERFGSIETIEKAKFELLEALPDGGTAVVNNDAPRVRRLADDLAGGSGRGPRGGSADESADGLAGRNHGPQVRRYGMDVSAGELDLAAEEVRHGPDGLSFTLVERGGARTPVKTRLIGLHNVSNILASALVARTAGSSMREIAGAIGRLQPVPHRLETHTGPDGVTIVDDAYNSNPIGAANALDTLNEFDTGRKILVTPGMVELGAEQDARNQEFGVKAAAVCDFVILVGPNQTAAIRRGLESAGFAAERITSARNLTDGLAAMRGIVRAGDVVLFENDLPDLYEE